ncbi:MAG: hypothetical protein R3332_11345 [Pseudohongiellaceae bacterium]|nr:hypothetical protein [Pseudohongiellaceae bacterium]
MKKIFLWTFFTSIVLVNAVAWLVAYFSDVTIAPLFRIALIVGICFISMIFAGAAALLGFLESEDPDKQWNSTED